MEGKITEEEIEKCAKKLSMLSKKYSHFNNISQRDLRQSGIIGITRAKPKFDPDRGVKFPNYAYDWIKNHMIKSIIDSNDGVSLSPGVYNQVIQYWKIYQELYVRYGYEHTHPEVINKTGLSCGKIQDILFLTNIMSKPSSLSQTIHIEEKEEIDTWEKPDRGKILLGDTITDPNSEKFLDEINSKEIGTKVREILKTLSPKEEKIIRLRYGIKGEGPLILEEIGKKFKVSRERIRQIEKDAFRKLRHHTRSKKLKPLIED